MKLDQIQALCLEYLSEMMSADPAHDLSHVRRVVQNTIRLTESENGNAAIAIPAAWLHDCVSVAKDSPLRKQASKLAAEEALRFLGSVGYPTDLHEDTCEAVVHVRPCRTRIDRPLKREDRVFQ